MSNIAPKQVSTATFQQPCNILDIGSGEAIQTDFEHVEDQMRGHDSKLREVGQERDVLRFRD